MVGSVGLSTAWGVPTTTLTPGGVAWKTRSLLVTVEKTTGLLKVTSMALGVTVTVSPLAGLVELTRSCRRNPLEHEGRDRGRVGCGRGSTEKAGEVLLIGCERGVEVRAGRRLARNRRVVRGGDEAEEGRVAPVGRGDGRV